MAAWLEGEPGPRRVAGNWRASWWSWWSLATTCTPASQLRAKGDMHASNLVARWGSGRREETAWHLAPPNLFPPPSHQAMGREGKGKKARPPRGGGNHQKSKTRPKTHGLRAPPVRASLNWDPKHAHLLPGAAEAPPATTYFSRYSSAATGACSTVMMNIWHAVRCLLCSLPHSRR